MTRPTIAALVGGSQLAISEAALPLLQMELPEDDAGAVIGMEALAGSVQIERGERYAVHGGVAYVPVRGVLTPNSAVLERYLGWATYHGLAETMAELAANDEVRAAVMLFDTPGGSVLAIQAAVGAIKAAAQVMPVHALVHPLAASAGYWLASGCTDITMTPGAWVGSVGTMHTAAQPMQPGGSGAQIFIQTSAHAGAKRPDLSTDEGKALTQTRLDEMEADFLATVAEGRNIPADEVAGRMSRTDSDRDGGDVFWGDDAVSRGLADGVETLADFMARISSQYAPKPRAKSRAYLAQAEAAKAIANN